jgi:ribosome biogenesis GTPase
MQLESIGWNDYFSEQAAPYLAEGRDVGRVAEQHRTEYVLFTRFGELRAAIAGKIRLTASSRADWPAVGDWVVIEPRPAESFARIVAILPRRSCFSRQAAGTETEEQILAANMDTAFWVTTPTAEFNPRRVERFLAAVYESGACPALILNKADLAPEPDLQKLAGDLQAAAPGLPIHIVSALRQDGFESLAPYLQPGRTVVFLGVSGVGKSSIVNALLGADRLAIGEIRESDSRGRHTTTTRQLIILPNGGLVIDTPGIRELQIWDAESIAGSFADIEALAPLCRFADCLHETEPGCAVRHAVECGEIDDAHYRNYLKIRRELARLEGRKSVRSRIEEKRRLRQFGKIVKEFNKRSPKR